MSEKQRFNNGAYIRQIAEKRRERWFSRKILSEIIDAVRRQRDDANWIIYQILKKDSENLTYKSKIKMFNWLANSGYDVENLRPSKIEEINKKLINAQTTQKILEENYKLYQQLQEANRVVKQIAENWSGLAGKDWCPAFSYIEKYNIGKYDV